MGIPTALEALSSAGVALSLSAPLLEAWVSQEAFLFYFAHQPSECQDCRWLARAGAGWVLVARFGFEAFCVRSRARSAITGKARTFGVFSASFSCKRSLFAVR